MTSPRLVTRWDLDKTYLRSEFYTPSDLLKSFFERPDQKRAVPGASRLLRELSHGDARVHIVSGSPRQMREVIVERLRLDGVRFDELTLKPNLNNLMRLRFRALRDQLGYKLGTFLTARMAEQEGLPSKAPPPEVLVGDDSEADAFVYSLFADVCQGNVDTDQLEAILEAGDGYPEDTERCLMAVRAMRPPQRTPPESARAVPPFRILIHLDRQTPPSRFASYGMRLVPFFNYVQAALVLLEDGHLSPDAVYRVAAEMVEQHRFNLHSLTRSYIDVLGRGHVSRATLDRLRDGRPRAPSSVAPWPARIEGELDQEPPSARLGRLTPVAPPDYLKLAKHHRGGRNRRR